MRGGTECLHGIVGLSKAMQVAYRDLENHSKHIKSLKEHMIHQIKLKLPFITFNGMCSEVNYSLYTVLSISFPQDEFGNLLLFNLDLLGVSCSGGSACSSGNVSQSHVISQIETQNGPVVRFSFGKFNTLKEIDLTVDKLASLFNQ